MTTIILPRATVEQALDALKDDQYRMVETAEGHWEYKTDLAIAALERALAQQQPNPPGCDHCNHPLYAATRCRVCGRVTEQAEPVEPVAWLAPRNVDSYSRPDLGYETCSETDYGAFPVYTAPPQRKPLTVTKLLPRKLPEDNDE